jgi:hypothetical protein
MTVTLIYSNGRTKEVGFRERSDARRGLPSPYFQQGYRDQFGIVAVFVGTPDDREAA